MTAITDNVISSLKALSIPEKAAFFPRFFKTGKGEYGEGDQFLGVIVPEQRKVAKAFYAEASLDDVATLLTSVFHEVRLTALFMLVLKYEKTTSNKQRNACVDFYLNNLQYINNWDLVDSTAHKILGRYCFENKTTEILQNLSDSDRMWNKRIAVVATLYFIKKKYFEPTKTMVLNNLHHSHDLMHKANGWMLREMGKQNEKELIDFLKKYYKTMPRTTLRYAIEKLDYFERENFLKGKI